jgi:hypothetical protein
MPESESQDDRILLDPSIILREDAFPWIAESPQLFVVSSAFRGQLAEGQILPGSQLLPPGANSVTNEHVDRILTLLDQGGIQLFSYYDADLPTDRSRVVAEILRDSGDPADMVDAEQWVYLQTQSVAFALRRRMLDAFKRAGAVVEEFGRNVLDEAIARVIPAKHLDRYSPQELVTRGLIKWVIVGGFGAAAGFFGNIPGAIAGTGLADVLVRAVDP